MTDHQAPQMMRVYVSGWLDYRIDNPNALADASAVTPDEIDPEGKTNLRSMPEAMYRSPNFALALEVSKRFNLPGAAARNVPGATYVQCGGVQLTMQPPAQQGQARSA